MIISADTETIKNPDGSMRVWLCDICIVDGNFGHETWIDLDGFFEWSFKQKEQVISYWHNLKYDGSYLINWLHFNGFHFSESVGEPNTYNFLVTDRSVWFLGSATNADGKTVIFRDSFKKIPLPVKKIAKAYGLPMSKGEIDYKKPRPYGYQPDENELSYVRGDTEIVARALWRHFQQGMDKLTAPADAIEELKKTTAFESKFVTKWWASHKSAETFCRKSYCGGISWVNPDIKDKEVKHGLVYDYNSMYPSVMLMYPFPTGCPVRWYNKPTRGYPLYIARAKVNISRIPGKPACIRDPSARVWIEDEYEGELYLTNVDVELLQENYYGECELIDGYCWKGEKGVFDDFINHWAEIKKTTKDAGMRQIAKLMLNSAYGKFGTNPMRAHKIPVWDTGVLKWRNMPPEEGKTFNVAVASFVTAYARRELVRGINASTGFCYCDTDSVHLASIDGKAARFVGVQHPTDFGAWKFENRFVRAKYLRQKTYIEEKPDGKLLIAACGCPDSSKNYITFHNFAIGASFKGKLRPTQRKGGCELVETRFTIRAPIDRF